MELYRHNLKIFFSRSFFVVFLLHFIPGALNAQELNKYRGDYILQGDTTPGYAEFNYELKGSDTIKQGDFLFRSTVPEVESDYFMGIEFDGEYLDNRKNGNWTFKRSRFRPSGTPQIVNDHITYPATGTRYSVKAAFKNGLANNSWEVLSGKIDSGLCVDTAFWVIPHFDAGNLTGEFKGKTKLINLSGYFSDAGLITGEWVAEHKIEEKQIEEFRFYDNGILKRLFFLVDNERVEIDLPGFDIDVNLQSENLDTISIDNLYFRVILNSAQKANDKDLTAFIDSTNRLLYNAMSSVQTFNNRRIWKLIPGSDKAHFGRVVLKKYVLSKDEKDFAQTASRIVGNITEILKDFFDDAQIDISRHSFEDLSLQYETMKVYRQNIEELEEIVRVYNSDYIQYLDRTEFSSYLEPELKTGNSQIVYDFKDNTKSEHVEFADLNSTDKERLSQWVEYLEEVLEKVKEINKLSEERVEQFKKETKLNEAEKKLIVTRDTLLSLYNREEQPDTFNDFHFRITPKVRSFIKTKFDNYASLSVEGRLEEGEILLNCFKELVFLYDVLAEQPDKREKIDDLYMRNVWSPFTLTYMDERVKERLYETYENIIYPESVDRLMNNITCKSFRENAENLNLIYSKMVKLRDQDTKQLERDLRRVNDLEEINEIMNLNLTLD